MCTRCGNRACILLHPWCRVCCLWLDACCSVPSDTEFPWRQVRPSASNEDMKRWTTALHSLPLRTPTMTSPAVTALTAVTASTPLPAPHLPVRNTGRRTLKANKPAFNLQKKCLITLPHFQPRPSSDSTSRHREGNGYVSTWWRCITSPGGRDSPACPARGAAPWAWPVTTPPSDTTPWGSLPASRKRATGTLYGSTCAKRSSMPARWRWGSRFICLITSEVLCFGSNMQYFLEYFAPVIY